MFKRIRESKPEVFYKIIPVFGDIVIDRLGLNDEHFERVSRDTQIVFHLAATLKLEATLKPAVEMNIAGTHHVLEVCKNMPKLVVLLHLSTAFCNCDQDVLREEIFDWPHRPKDLINCAKWMSEESMEAMSKTMMEPHPNTYTYTKRMAEILVRDEFPNLPVCVVRPSIGKLFNISQL
jgi:fatty acyl-CoA reductase